MAAEPPPRDTPAVTTQENAIAVISAYGAFRVLLVLLAAWTFFAGFSLLTQGVGALSFGGGPAAERVVGAQMLVLVPVYGILAWRRDEYRLLLWVPYAAQLAIIVPTFYDLTISHSGRFQNSALIFIVSLIFFVLLVYVWWSSHPLHHFAGGGGEDAEEDWDEEEEAEGEDSTAAPDAPHAAAPVPRRSASDDDRRRIVRPPPV
ncbi:MAG: hypothetical protein KGK07_14105 [Chloroflexota bacterium]|nr:hypothetical protein [Chloroflexota bacterium]